MGKINALIIVGTKMGTAGQESDERIVKSCKWKAIKSTGTWFKLMQHL